VALAALKAKARQFARVPVDVVSQVDTDHVQSDETAALFDALKTYSAARPRFLVADFPALASGVREICLPDLILGWSGSWRVERIWWIMQWNDPYFSPSGWSNGGGLGGWDDPAFDTAWPMNGPSGPRERLFELRPGEWMDLQKGDGKRYLRFLGRFPINVGYSLDYFSPHLIDSTHDTVSDQYPQDVDALCHLAASKILQMAANRYAGQSSSTLNLDTVDTAAQTMSYAARANEQRKLYEESMTSLPPQQAAPKPITGTRVDWGRADRKHRFWPRGRA